MFSARQASMVAPDVGTFGKGAAPDRLRSTRSSQLDGAGVKWRWKRVCAPSDLRTAGR